MAVIADERALCSWTCFALLPSGPPIPQLVPGTNQRDEHHKEASKLSKKVEGLRVDQSKRREGQDSRDCGNNVARRESQQRKTHGLSSLQGDTNILTQGDSM